MLRCFQAAGCGSIFHASVILLTTQPHQATYLGAALDAVDEQYDRIIVITDEQSHDRISAPRGKGYVINVASARNGVGYGPWVHFDGFSEAVINYIREFELTEGAH